MRESEGGEREGGDMVFRHTLSEHMLSLVSYTGERGQCVRESEGGERERGHGTH